MTHRGTDELGKKQIGRVLGRDTDGLIDACSRIEYDEAVGRRPKQPAERGRRVLEVAIGPG